MRQAQNDAVDINRIFICIPKTFAFEYRTEVIAIKYGIIVIGSAMSNELCKGDCMTKSGMYWESIHFPAHNYL